MNLILGWMQKHVREQVHTQPDTQGLRKNQLEGNVSGRKTGALKSNCLRLCCEIINTDLCDDVSVNLFVQHPQERNGSRDKVDDKWDWEIPDNIIWITSIPEPRPGKCDPIQMEIAESRNGKMKKFIANKINKQHWRVTVPNLNSALFRKSPAKDEDKSDKESKRSSGFYDLQEAQLEYDKTRSLPNSVYVDTSSSEDDEDNYEDARAASDRSSNNLNKDTSDTDLYVDVESSQRVESTNLSVSNGKFEYDVPRISFKFFDKNKNATTPVEEEENADLYENDQPNYEPVNVLKVVKSEVKIVLSSPPLEDKEAVEETDVSREETPKTHPSEKFVSQTAIFVKSLEDIPVVIKSAGSDPNLVLHEHDDEDSSDGFYKVPRSLKKTHRLSQSLNDFDFEKLETVAKLQQSSNHSSIEHISASQVILQEDVDKTESSEQKTDSERMDYCKVRSRLPLRFKRPVLLKKPKKAVNTWNNFRTKFNNLMLEHAAQQRVGAFGDKDKVTINFEEMYKNSKTKCKNVLRNTGKIFNKGKKDSFEEEKSGSESAVKSNASSQGLKASDIKYILNTSDSSEVVENGVCEKADEDEDDDGKPTDDGTAKTTPTPDDDKKEDFDFTSIKTALKKKLFTSESEGQNGFEDVRRYVKQGGDFCKELSAILQERAEAETQYAKSLSKLSAKLSRACRDGVGGLNEAWKAVAQELEARAEGHRLMGMALLEETAKPLRSLTESQHRVRKQSETGVDKAARLLADWRATEAKGKKQSHACARENEKLQDAAVLDTTKYGKQTISKSTSLIHLAHIHGKQNSSDKENAKLEGKKRKAEDAVKKADIEYYTLCVRAERARLEWEAAVLRGVNTFQSLEEERLSNLKSVLTSYLHHSNDLGPRLIEATERIKGPITQAEPTKDITAFQNLRYSSQQVSEQLLPDFYCEHITLAMNRERRKQALVKLLHLIRQDIERERKSKNGLENLSKAIKQTPNFGTEDSQQTVTEKLYHMKSMLTYLEGARYKVQSALAELDSRPRAGHPLAPHITITRDKSGLQQSVLKVPQWLREEWFEQDRSPLSEKSLKSDKSDNSDPHINDVDDPEWPDRGAADGNSNQPDSDFDEFSSQCSSSGGNLCSTEESPVQPIATCRAIYPYTPNLPDELPLKPGDILSVYRQQDDGWWLGECSGSVGIFPATYVEIVKDC
ncbi:hypothetical protein NQ315_005571 [Exocentrus adspersus]|uniref:Nostrin n=1 Tax=Exocentrus adspersus TaxID=1586481 RepID=A0AAV8VT66_9CUCU|nr:hypothetical protein NQ315_005571 [Exocentrus adspersus]